jgi:hypothetical protein
VPCLRRSESLVAPSNGTPWYQSCTAKAVGSGLLNVGVDALGFIPGEKDVQAAVEIGSGTVARACFINRYGLKLETSA